VAKLLRVGIDRVRGWIARGELVAINVADPGRPPRLVVLPDALETFLRGRQTTPPPKPVRRKKRTTEVDFYP
jgi:hypothetical protein